MIDTEVEPLPPIPAVSHVIGIDDRLGPAGCYGDTPTVTCMACSVLTGPEQGEWQGQVDVLVPAPCSILTAMAAHIEGGRE